MHRVLRGLLYQNTLVYIDDILIFSKNFKEHLEHLTEVFRRFREANLRLHPKKCVFAVRKIKYLGYFMSHDGIEMDQSKVKAMQNFPTPTSVKTLKSFLGLCSFYRRFIRGYSDIVSPMHVLLKKDTKFVWTDKCETAFNKLKHAMSTAPILRFPDFNKPFTLVTDASYQALSYILCQEDDGKTLHPVGYGGRCLRDNERKFSVTEIELASILEACKHFHPYLANRPFKVLCDHVSLKYLATLKVATGRLARWAMYLMSYNMEIIHIPGKINYLADAFSRRDYPPDKGEINAEQEFEDMLMNIENESVSSPYAHNGKTSLLIQLQYPDHVGVDSSARDGINSLDDENDKVPQVIQSDYTDIGPVQRACPDFRDVMAYLEKGVLPHDMAAARHIMLKSESYLIADGRLYHLWEPSATKNLDQLKPVVRQLCVPRSLRGEIIEGYHHQNSHVGFERTYNTVRRAYYWPNLYSELHDIIVSCQECQKSKKNPRMKHVPLTPIPCESLFDRVHVDLVGPLVTSPEGYKYILTIVESFSRFPVLVALKSQRADELSEAIFSHVFCNWGAVLTLVSDLGKNLTSKVMKCLCDKFKVKHVFTSSYHAQSNSCCENLNRNIWNTLRVYCEDQQQWPKFLPAIMYSYRATVNVTTGLTPFECMYGGRRMRLPVDVQFEQPRGLPQDADTFLKGLCPRIKLIDEIVKKNTEDAQVIAKGYYDRNSQEPDYKVGDKCWLLDMKRTVGVNKKMQKKFTGPWIIVQRGDKNSYKLRHSVTDIPLKHTVHGNRMKPCIDDRSDLYYNIGSAKGSQVSNGTQSGTAVNRTLNASNVDGNPDLGRTGPSQTSMSDVQPSTGSQVGMKEIAYLKGRKGFGKNIMFHVVWKDGTTSWEKATIVPTSFKKDFYKNKKYNMRRRKRIGY